MNLLGILSFRGSMTTLLTSEEYHLITLIFRTHILHLKIIMKTPVERAQKHRILTLPESQSSYSCFKKFIVVQGQKPLFPLRASIIVFSLVCSILMLTQMVTVGDTRHGS